MNKTNLVIEIILALLIVWLLVDKFSNNEKENTEAEAVEEVTDERADQLKIAYINIDSLLLNYKLAIKLNNQFADKQRQSQRELENRMTKFQKNYEAFQKKAQMGGFLTESSMKAQQNELITEQQELEQLNNQLSTDLMAEEQRLNRQLYDTISNFVSEYNLTMKYDLILSNTMVGTVLYGQQKLNITSEVLEALNKRYDSKQSK